MARVEGVNNVAYRTFDQLPDPLVGRILHAAETTESVDGVAPLDEASQLALKNPQPHQHVIVALEGDDVVGVAQLRGTPTARELDCFVSPAHRQQGIATALWQHTQPLLDQKSPDQTDRQILTWSHGDLPGSKEFAAKVGFQNVRELWFMKKPDLGSLTPVTTRDDVTLSTFATRERVEDFLAVNAAAFSDHPEQGGMTAADVELRSKESWYNPHDIILVSDPETNELLGFHWLKVTRDGAGSPHGEVYIIAVSPQAQGRGLGRYLLDVGLEQLAKHGIDAASLYVEKANQPAVALYEAEGFELARRHVQYQL